MVGSVGDVADTGWLSNCTSFCVSLGTDGWLDPRVIPPLPRPLPRGGPPLEPPPPLVHPAGSARDEDVESTVATSPSFGTSCAAGGPGLAVRFQSVVGLPESHSRLWILDIFLCAFCSRVRSTFSCTFRICAILARSFSWVFLNASSSAWTSCNSSLS